MNKLQKGLDFLLGKYTEDIKATIKENGTVEIEGREILLLPWRHERRFIELKNLVSTGTVSGISAIRACRIDKKGTDILSMIYREIDLCQWILGSKVSSINYFANGSSAVNLIAKLESGVVCTIEVAATLSNDAPLIDKHEIISQRGVACDRVVDTQVPQNSIYVFGKNIDTYLDVDFELFGYSVEEIALIRQAFEVAKDTSLASELLESAKHLDTIMGRIIL